MEPKANHVDQKYCDLMCKVASSGISKSDRTGVGTRSIFGEQLRFDLSKGFPLLTSKKMYFKGVVVELLWFLGAHLSDARYAPLGRTNIKYMVDNDCFIWVGDAYKRYANTCVVGDSDWASDWTWIAPGIGGPRLYTKKEFINLIKTDEEFALKWGDLGPVYGKQWRDWGRGRRVYKSYSVLRDGAESLEELHDKALLSESTCEVEKKDRSIFQLQGGRDQIAELIDTLRDNPDSRRMLVTAWNPDDLEESILPPCHYGFQCYASPLTIGERWNWLKANDEESHNLMVKKFAGYHKCKQFMDLIGVPTRKLSLAWNQRSVDIALGLPFNIASYALLTHMLAKEVNMIPGELIANLGDCHIYNNQLDKVNEQLSNETHKLCTLKINESYGGIDNCSVEDFSVENYNHAGVVSYPLSN